MAVLKKQDGTKRNSVQILLANTLSNRVFNGDANKDTIEGRELMEVSLSIEFISGLTKSPSKHLQMLKDFMELGKFASLIIGFNVIGEFPFLITGIEETLSHFNVVTGEFDFINLDITLLEYVDDPLQYQKKIEYRQSVKTFLGIEYEDTVKKLQKKVFK